MNRLTRDAQTGHASGRGARARARVCAAAVKIVLLRGNERVPGRQICIPVAGATLVALSEVTRAR